MDSAAGDLLRRAASLVSAQAIGFSLTLADVTAEEFLAMEVLRTEQEKYREEKDRQRGAFPNSRS